MPSQRQWYRAGINIAFVAVAMDDGGLITPVLQDGSIDIYYNRNWKALVDRARQNSYNRRVQQHLLLCRIWGCLGVDRFGAILESGSIWRSALPTSGCGSIPGRLMGVRQQMQTNSTCDHRIICGATAAAFMQIWQKLIEEECKRHYSRCD